jgi:hypothetical protein
MAKDTCLSVVANTDDGVLLAVWEPRCLGIGRTAGASLDPSAITLPITISRDKQDISVHHQYRFLLDWRVVRVSPIRAY